MNYFSSDCRGRVKKTTGCEGEKERGSWLSSRGMSSKRWGEQGDLRQKHMFKALQI